MSAIIAAGVLPAAIEMMDALAIEAAEAAVHCGYPQGAGAVLIVELDGPARRGRGAVRRRSRRHCREHERVRDPHRRRRRRAGAVLEGPQVGVRRGRPDQPRLHRAGRRDPAHRAARGAAAHRRAVRRRVRRAGRQRLPRRRRQPAPAGALRRAGRRARPSAAEEVSGAILDLCIEHGGSITGEHGVGIDKAKYMPRMFTDDDLDTMQLLRCAFDPRGLANPGKVFPTPRLCGEVPGRHKGAHPLQRGRAWRRCSEMAPTPSSTTLAQGLRRPRRPAREDDRRRRRAALRRAPGLDRGGRRGAAGRRPRTACTVVARGAGTKLGWGAAADAPSTWSLDTTPAGPASSSTRPATSSCVVRAGTPLADAAGSARRGRPAARARRRRCRRRRVGGTLADRTSGPRRLLRGTLRDLLIGVTVRARRRRRREGRRQGREERRRLRPRQAAHRLLRHARRRSPRPCSGCTRARRRSRVSVGASLDAATSAPAAHAVLALADRAQRGRDRPARRAAGAPSTVLLEGTRTASRRARDDGRGAARRRAGRRRATGRRPGGALPVRARRRRPQAHLARSPGRATCSTLPGRGGRHGAALHRAGQRCRRAARRRCPATTPPASVASVVDDLRHARRRTPAASSCSTAPARRPATRSTCGGRCPASS